MPEAGERQIVPSDWAPNYAPAPTPEQDGFTWVRALIGFLLSGLGANLIFGLLPLGRQVPWWFMALAGGVFICTGLYLVRTSLGSDAD